MTVARLIRPLLLMAATTLAVPAGARAQAAPAPAFDAVGEAKKVVADLSQGRFAAVEARFTPEMAQAIPAGQLAQLWAQLIAQAGAFKEVAEPTMEEREGMRIVTFPATYESAKVHLRVVWNADRKLAGLQAQPAG